MKTVPPPDPLAVFHERRARPRLTEARWRSPVVPGRQQAEPETRTAESPEEPEKAATVTALRP